MIFNYIHTFYNPVQHRSSLGFIAPCGFRKPIPQ